MTSSCKNLYHVKGLDTTKLLDTYFSNKPDMAFGVDALQRPIEKLHQALIRGNIKGKILTDMSIGPVIHHLISICEFFNEIIVLKFTDKCIMELNRWRHDRTGAYDWTHTTGLLKQLDGKSDEEKLLKLKTTIKHVVKCDPEKPNLIDPLDLPQADCLISGWLLECISKDEEEYVKNVKKFLEFLKPGGHLIMVTVLNATYYKVGEETYHILTCQENFVKETLTGEGLTIDDCEVFQRTAESDLTDYTAFMILIARKDQQISAEKCPESHLSL